MMSLGGRSSPIPTDHETHGPSLFLPRGVADAVAKLLVTYGRGRHEGIVYLGGRETGDGAIALTALSPNATTSRGSFRTDVNANADVVSCLHRSSLTLIGQVHSHPGDWVDHSEGDDEGALVKFEGYWSIVVPSFARRGLIPLERCGVHLFKAGRFRRLSVAAVGARVRVLPAAMDLRRGG